MIDPIVGKTGIKAAGRLARPGRNCWKVAAADRLAVLVDGESYYTALAEVLPRARRSILMLGWEFDSRTRLVRDGQELGGLGLAGLPNEIGPLLDRLAHRGIDIRVLIWDSALLYAFNREFAGLVKMDWLTHRRLHFRLDDSHPLSASHHQKIVVIDDALAFVGGLDVTSQRWDSRRHSPGDIRRTDPAFPDYPPFHDVMAMLAGEAAGVLADLVRERWRQSSGERLRVWPAGDWRSLWPAGFPPEFERLPVAVARTSAAWDGEPAAREVEALYLDMIAAAERLIFIENQYFASRRIAAAIAARLRRPGCPEIVVIGPGNPVSLLERSTMGVARARLYQRLLDADRGGRFRLYYPTSGGDEVKVHSKVMVVDDRWLRIGSSNLNNRSMGLDTECDILVEAGTDLRIAESIARTRRDLLAEHLGVDALQVAAAEAGQGVHAAIATLSGGPRSLVPLDSRAPSSVVRLIADSGIPDPETAVETMIWVEEAMPGPAKRPLQMRVLALNAMLILLPLAAALWRFAPPVLWEAAHPWIAGAVALRAGIEAPAAVLAFAAFVVGTQLRLPPSLLAAAAALALGFGAGITVSLAGGVTGALLTYGLGRMLGRARVRRLAGWKVHRVNRALSHHGAMAIMLLRLMPVAAFFSINLVAGAAAVRLRDFVVGTLIGMMPGVVAISVLGDRVVEVLRRPDLGNIVVLAVTTALVVAAGIGLLNRLGRARGGGGRRPQEA